MDSAAGTAGVCLIATALLLMIIMLPSSFVYFGYDEIGFIKYTVNNNVNTDKTYELGRYYTGPFFKAVVFPRNHQRINSRLAIFTDDGQEFNINLVTFYRLDINRLAEMYDNFGTTSWNNQASIRIDSTIKSMAPMYKIDDYITMRNQIVEEFFYGNDIYDGLASDLESIGMILELDKFWMAEVEVPDAIMQRNLDAAVQLQVNEMEENNREVLLVETETIRLEAIILGNITRVQAGGDAEAQNINAAADASILTLDAAADAQISKEIADANAEADNLLATTDGDGLAEIFDSLNITDINLKSKYIAYFALLDEQTLLAGSSSA